MLSRTKVLVACKIPKASIDLLRENGLDPDTAERELPENPGDYDAVLIRGNVKADAAFLARLKQGSVLIRLGVGLDNIDLKAAQKLGVRVFNTAGSSAVSVAEHILGLMLALARDIPACSQRVKSGAWPKAECGGIEISGKTLGIVGYGCSGTELARRARALEMKVIAYDKYKRIDSGAKQVSYEELLAISDFISFNVPLTEETRNMFGFKEVSIVKRGVRIINASRGEVVSVEALLSGLEKGIIAGVALDVLPHEPPTTSEEKKLIADRRVIVTPHIAGSTEEAEQRAVALACDIIRKQLHLRSEHNNPP
ncbi:MAG: NAD(P)-dependent oxidoreductase [Thermoprotei archaeon]